MSFIAIFIIITMHLEYIYITICTKTGASITLKNTNIMSFKRKCILFNFYESYN